jgi:hypothetical protein
VAFWETGVGSQIRQRLSISCRRRIPEFIESKAMINPNLLWSSEGSKFVSSVSETSERASPSEFQIQTVDIERICWLHDERTVI